MVTTKELKSIFKYGSDTHKVCARNMDYYDGIQKIKLETNDFAGRKTIDVVSNWIKFAIDQHVSFSVGNDIIYKSTVPENPELDEFKQMYKDQYLNNQNREDYKASLVCGYAVNVIEFDEETREILIKNYNPIEWAFVKDENSDEIVMAIHTAVFLPGSLYNAQILEKKVTVITVYDDETIQVFIKKGNKIEPNEPIEHPLGELPVIVYQTDAEYKPLITNSLINQQDIYNVLSNGQDIDTLYIVNALLAIKGLSPGALTKTPKDSNGKVLGPAAIEEMKRYGVIYTEGDGQAQFITKGSFKENWESSLHKTKQMIYTEAKIVDTSELVGANINTEADAMEMRWQPVFSYSKFSTNYFKEGLNNLIKKINKLREFALGLGPIENYEIIFTFNLPKTNSEFYDNLKEILEFNLLDEETLLSQFSFIDDPKAIIEKKRAELAVKALENENKQKEIEKNEEKLINKEQDNRTFTVELE